MLKTPKFALILLWEGGIFGLRGQFFQVPLIWLCLRRGPKTVPERKSPLPNILWKNPTSTIFHQNRYFLTPNPDSCNLHSFSKQLFFHVSVVYMCTQSKLECPPPTAPLYMWWQNGNKSSFPILASLDWTYKHEPPSHSSTLYVMAAWQQEQFPHFSFLGLNV